VKFWHNIHLSLQFVQLKFGIVIFNNFETMCKKRTASKKIWEQPNRIKFIRPKNDACKIGIAILVHWYTSKCILKWKKIYVFFWKYLWKVQSSRIAIISFNVSFFVTINVGCYTSMILNIFEVMMEYNFITYRYITFRDRSQEIKVI